MMQQYPKLRYPFSNQYIHNDDIISIQDKIIAVVLMIVPEWQTVMIAVSSSQIYDVPAREIKFISHKSIQNNVFKVRT